MSFDIFDENGIKYLFPYLYTESKPEFLYAFCAVFWEYFILIWKYFHGTIGDVDQVDQHFNSLMAPYYVAA